MRKLKILIVTLAVLVFSLGVISVGAHGPEDGESFHHGHHGHHIYWTPDYYSGPYYNYGTPFVAPGCFWNWKNYDGKSSSQKYIERNHQRNNWHPHYYHHNNRSRR